MKSQFTVALMSKIQIIGKVMPGDHVPQVFWNARTVNLRIIPYIGILLFSTTIWLPFSFKTTGIYEEWVFQALFDSTHPIFFITPTSPFNSSVTRPLEIFDHALAYFLDPDSFLFFNVIHLFAFALKMVAAYELMIALSKQKHLLSLLVAILFGLYPADSGTYVLRTIHIHTAVLLFMVASLMFILFWTKESRSRWLLLILANLSLVFSILQYQIALPLAAFIPILCMLTAKTRLRELVGVLSWYSSLAGCVVYVVVMNAVLGGSYDGVLLNVVASSGINFWVVVDGLILGLYRQFLSWMLAFGKLEYLGRYLVFAVMALAAFLAMCLAVSIGSKKVFESYYFKYRRMLFLVAIGLLVVVLGMAIYLPYSFYIVQQFRIYFISMFGAAVVLGVFLYVVGSAFPIWQEGVASLLALPFVCAGLANAFEQKEMYTNASLLQQQLLQDVVAEVPQLKVGASILIVDESGALNEENMFLYGLKVNDAFSYLYGRNVPVYYCPGFGEQVNYSSKCDATDNRYLSVNRPATEEFLEIDYRDLIVFVNAGVGRFRMLSSSQADLDWIGYDPRENVVGNIPPARAETMFSCVPALSCYREPL